jgi:hypothetical protein
LTKDFQRLKAKFENLQRSTSQRIRDVDLGVRLPGGGGEDGDAMMSPEVGYH